MTVNGEERGLRLNGCNLLCTDKEAIYRRHVQTVYRVCFTYYEECAGYGGHGVGDVLQNAAIERNIRERNA